MQHSTTSTPQAVTALVEGQHEIIRGMLEEVAASAGEERSSAFDRLRRFVAAHEALEEQLIHPVGQRELGDPEVSGERIAEEKKACDVITRLEGLDVDSREFDHTFARLREEVVAHAEAEEHTELPAVTSAADAAALGQMQQALEFVAGLVAQERGPLGGHRTTFVSMLQSARREFEGLASQRND